MPSRLTRPRVGLIPTTMLAVPGLRIDPDVSVPTATVTRLAATAIPEPELDPPGVNTGRPSLKGASGLGSSRGSYGLKPYPPSGLYPDGMFVEMKFANSVSVAFPRMMAPASLSFCVMNASSGGTDPASEGDPAVVGMSSVSTLSFRRTGMPKSGLVLCPRRRSASRARASRIAFGLRKMFALTSGSYCSMRARYISTSCSEVMRPVRNACCRSAIVASTSCSRLRGGWSGLSAVSGSVRRIRVVTTSPNRFMRTPFLWKPQGATGRKTNFTAGGG